MEPPGSIRVNVINETGKRLLLEPIRRAVRLSLQRHGRERGTVNVLLTRDREIRALNKKFRNVDEATDVLSFLGDGFPGTPLGEIAISVPYATRQAKARGVSLRQELAYLAIHGALHLLGHDDIKPKQRLAMVAEMNEIAIAAGLMPDKDWHSLLHREQSAK